MNIRYAQNITKTVLTSLVGAFVGSEVTATGDFVGDDEGDTVVVLFPSEEIWFSNAAIPIATSGSNGL